MDGPILPLRRNAAEPQPKKSVRNLVVAEQGALGIWTGCFYRRDPERPAEKTGKEQREHLHTAINESIDFRGSVRAYSQPALRPGVAADKKVLAPVAVSCAWVKIRIDPRGVFCSLY